MMTAQSPIIAVSGLKANLGGNQILHDINFEIAPGEIIAIIGGSGCGKTTLLRSLLMLITPVAGVIKIFDQDIKRCRSLEALQIRKRWGVLFQNNALFSSLTLLENVLFPLQEYARLPARLLTEIARLKIILAGLEVDAADKYPAELSGGMQKRGALARAIALDPELLFLDEPTSGLDPNSAAGFDQLVLQLRNNLSLTIIMVTHDMDTLWTVPDRVIFLGEGKVLAMGTMAELVKATHPLIRSYFSGPRAQVQRRDTKGT